MFYDLGISGVYICVSRGWVNRISPKALMAYVSLFLVSKFRLVMESILGGYALPEGQRHANSLSSCQL